MRDIPWYEVERYDIEDPESDVHVAICTAMHHDHFNLILRNRNGMMKAPKPLPRCWEPV